VRFGLGLDALCKIKSNQINADVKIASRAISTRLAAALQPVIDPTQTGFLPGRWIGDNILSHTELADLLTAHY